MNRPLANRGFATPDSRSRSVWGRYACHCLDTIRLKAVRIGETSEGGRGMIPSIVETRARVSSRGMPKIFTHLRYFIGLVEEIGQTETPETYWQHVRSKADQLERQW